jgi:hypothetical protein
MPATGRPVEDRALLGRPEDMTTMRMLGTSVALIAAACSLAAAPAAGAAPAKKKARGCTERGTTVARSLQARLYVRTTDEYDRSLIGCVYRTGRRRVVDSWYGCGCSVADDIAPRVAALAGRFVAVAGSYSCGPPGFPCSAPDLYVIDLRSGRARHVIDGGGTSAVLLKPNGSIAYLLGSQLSPQLIRIDATGTAVLDEGPGIDPKSLAASAGRLYWMNGGTPRTAPFA